MKFKVQDNKSRPWFAWFLVRVYDYTEEANRVVWLETVMRAEVGYSWDRYYKYSINVHDAWYNKNNRDRNHDKQ